MAWSGIAKVGSMTEWPPWHPTKGEIERLGVPTFVPPGPDNPMGSRALYLYSGGKDTLFRIHGTNQPEYIGASISSGCIRMTNEDAIDLYNRVKMGTIVVVLEPHHGATRCRFADGVSKRGALRYQHRRCNGAIKRCCNAPTVDQIKSAGLPALFFCLPLCLRLFVGGVFVAGMVSVFGGAGSEIASGFAPSDLGVSDLAASRGGASSGRSAGSSGAICGTGPTHSTGRFCSCCAAPSGRDGCGLRDSRPSPAPAPSKTARIPNAARSRATRAAPCGRSAKSIGRWQA